MAKRRAPRRRRNDSSGRGMWLMMAIMVIALVGYGWWTDSLPGFDAPPKVAQQVETQAEPESSFTDKILEKTGLGSDKKVEAKEEKKEVKETKEEPKKDVKKEEKKQVKEPEKIMPAKPATKHKGKAKMAIVLDDFGYNNVIVYKYNAMHIPLTYAVLPFKTYSSTVAQAGHDAGNEIIVHLPMESESNIAAETNTIRTSMSTETIRSMAEKALSSVPYAIGMNNHQGSKATADPRVVEAVMGVVAQKGMFILDSRTTGASKIPMMAKKYGVPYTVNTLFLDNSNSVEDIKARLQQATNMALRDGSIVVIGHDRPNTCEALGQMVSSMQAQGIEFVFVSRLLQ